MIIKIKYLFVLMSLFSCVNEDKKLSLEAVDSGQFNFDLNYSFFLQNESGLDLIDPEKAISYNYNDIKVFEDEDLTKDITLNFIYGNSAYGIVNGPNEKGYMIALGLEMGNIISENKDEEISIHEQTYYLQLAVGVVDKITIQAISHSNGASLSKLIYNEEIIFSTTKEWKNWDGIIVK